MDSSMISLGNVIRALEDSGIDLKSMMILYYNNNTKMFYLCGGAEELDNYWISLKDIQNELQLKYRKRVYTIKPTQTNEFLKDEPEEDHKGKNKRTKERKIGEIITKVAEWRRLYAGKAESNGPGKKYS